MMTAAAAKHGGRARTRWHFRRNASLYIMLVPAAVFVILFNYIPMYGFVIAFQDFNPMKGFLGSPLAGFKWFQIAFESPNFWQVTYNTLFISLMKIAFSIAFPVLFALLLNEVHNRLFKRTVQTTVYFPNFLSWVIVGGIFLDLLSLGGPINSVLKFFGLKGIIFLGDNRWFRATLVATEVWKSFGWNAILYLAALSMINPELYEAAVIDGANRWRQTWHVTLPGIATTVILLATLSLGNVLNAGFEQVFMLYNPVVYRTGDIIDTFVYRIGLLGGEFSLATAVGLGKSVVGIVLISTSYWLAYKLTGYRIFEGVDDEGIRRLPCLLGCESPVPGPAGCLVPLPAAARAGPLIQRRLAAHRPRCRAHTAGIHARAVQTAHRRADVRPARSRSRSCACLSARRSTWCSPR